MKSAEETNCITPFMSGYCVISAEGATAPGNAQAKGP